MTLIPWKIKTIKHKKQALPYITWGLNWDLKNKRGDPSYYFKHKVDL